VLHHQLAQIADRLLAAASGGDAVVYAVPGDPCVAEMTVRLLRERAAPAGVQVCFPRVQPLSTRCAAKRL
jgi:uncharacterized protein YabN with tetrapyrrole methylase and pyrophosphatase domain